MLVEAKVRERILGIQGFDRDISLKLQNALKPFFVVDTQGGIEDRVYQAGFETDENREDYYVGTIHYETIDMHRGTIFLVSDFKKSKKRDIW